MWDHFFISPVGDTRTHAHTNNSKKICDVYLLWKQTRCSRCVLSCVHVKEIDLSKQGCVHKKQVREGLGGLPLPSGGWETAEPAHRRSTLVTHYCLSLQWHSRGTPGTQLVASVPGQPRCPSDRGLGAAAHCPCIYFVTSARVWAPLLWLSAGSFFAVPSILLLPQLSAPRPQSAPPPGLPPLPLPSSRTVRALKTC